MIKIKNIILILLLIAHSSVDALSPTIVKTITGAIASIGIGATSYLVFKARSIKDKQKRKQEYLFRSVTGAAAVVLSSLLAYMFLDRFTPSGRTRRALHLLSTIHQDPAVLLAEAYQKDPTLMSGKLNDLYGGFKRSVFGYNIQWSMNEYGNKKFQVPLDKQIIKVLPLLQAEERLISLSKKATKAESLLVKALQEVGADNRIKNATIVEWQNMTTRLISILQWIRDTIVQTPQYILQQDSFDKCYNAVRLNRKLPALEGIKALELDFSSQIK